MRKAAREKDTQQAQLDRRQRELETLASRKDTVQATLQQHQADLGQVEEMDRRVKELGIKRGEEKGDLQMSLNHIGTAYLEHTLTARTTCFCHAACTV